MLKYLLYSRSAASSAVTGETIPYTITCCAKQLASVQNFVSEGGKNMKFVCKICGYVYEGEAAPEQCPQCKQHGVMEPAAVKNNPYAGTQT